MKSKTYFPFLAAPLRTAVSVFFLGGLALQSVWGQAPAPGQQATPTQTPAASEGTAERQMGAGEASRQGRKRIGLALGGGGALGLSEIGVLRYLEEHHIPVDVIAGTSMGSLLAALYATGHTPDQMQQLTSDQVFSRVFRISADYRKMNFRRREDQRFLPGGFNLGLKKGVSIRNGVLLDYGLNEFLNAQFLPYGANFDFDHLALPFRCVATDILVGREAVFSRGPLSEAVRASISIPGVFPPLEDGGHIYVDGALVENLPVDVVKRELHADTVIAVSLPLGPPEAGDTASVIGVLQRSFSVSAWSNEVRSRQQADVVIEPQVPPGTTMNDYAKSEVLINAGYTAAQKIAPQLLKYRVDDAAWDAYLQQRHDRLAPPVHNIARVNVYAPSDAVAAGVSRAVTDLPGKKLNADQIDAKLDEARSDGRFETNYFLNGAGQTIDTRITRPGLGPVGPQGKELLHPTEKRGPGDQKLDELAEQQAANQGLTINTTNNMPGEAVKQPGNGGKSGPNFQTVAPVAQQKMAIATLNTPPSYQPQDGDMDLNLWVHDRAGTPPSLLIGGNVIAQTGGTARATIDAVLTQQDLFGYRSEGRMRMRFGYLTELQPEYYRRFGDGRYFVAPRLQFYRAPVYIWQNQKKVAERLTQQAGGGFDLGFSQTHFTEWRLGWQEIVQRWVATTGTDGLPDVHDNAQTARVLYRFNNQDRAMVPRHGLRLDASAGLMHIGASQNVPKIEAQGAYFEDIGHGNTLSFSMEGGTFANRNVPDPYRFTLGGPLRLTASSFEEYRGTDYFFVRPAYFRRIAELPQPLGQSIYVVGTYEFGRMYAPGLNEVNRNDVFFGLAAETPLGAITFGPAIGDHDHRKLVFTLGRFF